MKLLIILIFCFSQAFGQEIFCDYFDAGVIYTCRLTLWNPNGFDGFTHIPGEHLGHSTDRTVRRVFYQIGTSSNFPQIICQQFTVVNTISITISNPPNLVISENALRNCAQLDSFIVTSVLLSIHPHAFFNNRWLRSLDFGQTSMNHFFVEFLSRNPILQNFQCEGCHLINDVPSGFFQENPLLETVNLQANNLRPFRSEWFQNNINLISLSISGTNVVEIPRNFLNSTKLATLLLATPSISEIDFFALNQVEALHTLRFLLQSNELKALDFNIFERANSLTTFTGAMNCATLFDFNFNLNRAQNLLTLEPCFAAFDARILSFATSGIAPIFNSIRRERIILSVRTVSDAILTFSTHPDGVGTNFEVQLGVNGNSRSEIYVNGVWQTAVSTPGLLNSGRFVEFDISWQNGLIVVTHQHPILFHQIVNQFPVRFLGVRTRGFNASWYIRQVVV